jgi:uncharacterized iron-regulated membrane protein
MAPPKALNVWSRKLHRWGSLLVALPLLLVISTGLLLQLKKNIDWIQPHEQVGVGGPPALTLADLLDIAAGAEGSHIDSWDDVNRIDFRPRDGVAKVRARDGLEVQIDTATGEVLQLAMRRSDLIESLHDGSFFGEAVKLWVFLPAGLILLALWLTGIYLWLLPWWAKASRKRRNGSAPAA